jgi:DNA-binding transcriptional LysR family regulator
MDLDMAMVRAFVVTAEELHFSRSADRLFVTQQALSKRIQRLESQLSVRLLERSSQKVELTDTGRRFLPAAQAALTAADAAVATIGRLRETIQIDVLDERLAPMQLVRGLLAEDAAFPMEVSMRHGLDNALVALRRGEIDIAFGRVQDAGPLRKADLVYRPVLGEPLAVLVRADHPLADADEIELSALRGTPLWVPTGGGVGEWTSYLHQLSADWSLDLDRSGPALSLDYLVDEVRASAEMATLVGTRMALPEDERVRLIRIVRPVPLFPWSVVWRKTDPHPLLEQVLATAERFGPHGADLTESTEYWLPEPDRTLLSGSTS